MLYQDVIVERTSSQSLLSLNILNKNRLFPGFAAGDFTILYGSSSILSLSLLLCVRAQLPTQQGGLASNIIFIDGGNTFRLYEITRLARLHKLDPKQVLDHIYISRAFTAHQMTCLILEKLKDVVKRYKAKVVVISDISGLFLDQDILDKEARRIYSQVVTYLSELTQKNQQILLATYLPHRNSKRNNFLHALSCARANTIIALRQSKYKYTVTLEKHPGLKLGTVEIPTVTPTISIFM